MSCWCNSHGGYKTSIDPSEPMFPRECDSCSLDTCNPGFMHEVVPPFRDNIKRLKLGQCQPLGRPPPPSRCPNFRSRPDVCFWTVDDVCRWLSSIGYPRYSHFMRANQMTGSKLATMTVHDLRREGMRNFDDCIRIGNAIEQLTGRN